MAQQQSPKRPPGPPPLPPKVSVAKALTQEIEEAPESASASALHADALPPSNPADLTRVVEELLDQMVRCGQSWRVERLSFIFCLNFSLLVLVCSSIGSKLDSTTWGRALPIGWRKWGRGWTGWRTRLRSLWNRLDLSEASASARRSRLPRCTPPSAPA
jgi:hypothetical protein